MGRVDQCGPIPHTVYDAEDAKRFMVGIPKLVRNAWAHPHQVALAHDVDLVAQPHLALAGNDDDEVLVLMGLERRVAAWSDFEITDLELRIAVLEQVLTNHALV